MLKHGLNSYSHVYVFEDFFLNVWLKYYHKPYYYVFWIYKFTTLRKQAVYTNTTHCHHSLTSAFTVSYFKPNTYIYNYYFKSSYVYIFLVWMLLQLIQLVYDTNAVYMILIKFYIK